MDPRLKHNHLQFSQKKNFFIPTISNFRNAYKTVWSLKINVTLLKNEKRKVEQNENYTKISLLTDLKYKSVIQSVLNNLYNNFLQKCCFGFVTFKLKLKGFSSSLELIYG